MRLKKKFKTIMVISDTQEPCSHPDALEFCKEVKKKYKPDLVVQIGDYCDFGSMSSFDTDPDYLSPKQELIEVKKRTKEWEKVFPKMYITLGNHEMRLYRKALKAGLPSSVLKTFNEIIGAGKGWKFVEKLQVNWDNVRERILFVHTGVGASTKAGLSPTQHANCVHGHLHANYWIKYSSTTDALHWDMNVGCLIDDTAPVFKYNKSQTKRPILGVGIIKNSLPYLIPMVLNKNKRWIGKGSIV